MSDITYKGLPDLIKTLDRWYEQENLVLLHMKLFQAGLINAETLVAEWGVLGKPDFSKTTTAASISETLHSHSIATQRGPEQYVLRAYFAFTTHQSKVLREGESFHGQYMPYDRRDVYVFTSDFLDFPSPEREKQVAEGTAFDLFLKTALRHNEEILKTVTAMAKAVARAEEHHKQLLEELQRIAPKN